MKVLATLGSLYAPCTLIFTFYKTFLNTPYGHDGYVLHITNKVIRQLIYGSIAGKNETYFKRTINKHTISTKNQMTCT